MKLRQIALVVATGAALSACATVSITESTARRVSSDYVAFGDAEGVRAYVYGKRTLLEIDGRVLFLSIRDANGASVEYEREGRYYRLARRLDDFTVWVNARRLAFSAVQQPALSPAPDPAPTAESLAPVELAALVQPNSTPTVSELDTEIAALFALARKQLEEGRRLLEDASHNPSATGRELYGIHERLNALEDRLTSRDSAMVIVSFPTNSTIFNPSPEVAAALLPAAKAADVVKLRGRTDARVAGTQDGRIALGRAMAARRYLIENGVEPGKIKVAAKADGDFLVPNVTKEGKTVNRRVEIELVTNDAVRLKEQAAQLAQR